MILEAIKKEIKRRGETIYSFTKRQKIMHPVAMRMYLYSKRGISIKVLEKILRSLNLVVAPKNGKQTDAKSGAKK